MKILYRKADWQIRLSRRGYLSLWCCDTKYANGDWVMLRKIKADAEFNAETDWGGEVNEYGVNNADRFCKMIQDGDY